MSAPLTLLKRFACVGLSFAVLIGCRTAARAAEAFQTIAPHAILIDARTHRVLFEKAADDLVTPMSTVKILTAELVFREISEGRLKLDDEFTVSEHAWRIGGAPAGGAAMFLALNSKARVEDLIKGLIVASGNDAAIVLAEGVAGSEGAFVTRMNKRAAELGLKKSSFDNPWGMVGPYQKVTAREMGLLAEHVIRTYPDLYRYYAEKEFSWNNIHQQSRNPLLTMSIGADGLQTGNIDKESGFGLVGSAIQDGRRLIVVVYGLRTAKDRAEEARQLLQWGFRNLEAASSGDDEAATDPDRLGNAISTNASSPMPITGTYKCSSSAKRIALVVGNSAYPKAFLSNPINDADDVTALLRDKLCFKVIEAKDGNFATFSQRISEFVEASDGADVALFYYAGHAMQFQQTNYLLPVDAKLANELDLAQKTISAQNVVAALESRAKVSLVFLDSCRNNPIEDDFRRRMKAAQRGFGETRGLAPMATQGAETLVVFATRPNQQAADGSGRNSPFTRAFLEHFATPGKDVEFVMRDVTSRVLELTGGQQIPQRLTELRHGLVLLPAR